MQQALLRYYGNATRCIDHVTKENLMCHIYCCTCTLTIRIKGHGKEAVNWMALDDGQDLKKLSSFMHF
jgi:hypothetical protein